MNDAGCLRRHEVVLELENLRNVAERVSGLGVDRHAHQIVAGAIDEIAVGVDLKIAAPGVVGDAGKDRYVIDGAGCFLHRKEPVAVDGHIGGDACCRDSALRGNGGARKRGHRSRNLPVRCGCLRDKIDEAGAYALVSGGLRVGDVAGDVLERKGLRLQTRHRSIESIEDTHNIVSNSIRRPARGRNRRSLSQALCHIKRCMCFNGLNENAPVQRPGHNCRAGNNCRGSLQLADGAAGRNTSAKPSMQ